MSICSSSFLVAVVQYMSCVFPLSINQSINQFIWPTIQNNKLNNNNHSEKQ